MASAAKALQKLSEKIDAPIVMTTNARGIVPPSHPLGVSLSPSMPETRKLAALADVILAIGTEFGPTDYDFNEDGGFLTGYLIRVDIDPAQIRRGPAANLAVVANALETTSALSNLVETQCSKSGNLRAAKARSGTQQLPNIMHAQLHILDTIRTCFPDAIIVGDQTQLVYAGNTAFSANTPSSYFNSATGFGTLGYGLPAAIGASLAAPERPVVALIGDGGFQFSIAELTSATESGTPIIVILHNNNGYGEIKSYMEGRNISPIGVDILTPDFKAIAIACGWDVEEAPTLKNLSRLLTQVIKAKTPQLIIIEDNLITDFEDLNLPELPPENRTLT
ncbi:thiamine pyrophosphate-dependent enzyme [Roseovarius aestuarii]|nr:thiamine pyrophosphate-dependent enzyme [Roseovarius aestuarii]